MNTKLYQEFEIELPEDEVQHAIHGRLEADSPERGFRSASKMPLSFILKRYGAEFLAGVLQEMLKHRMNIELAARGIDVAGNLTITGLWHLHDRPLRYRYRVSCEAFPKFDLQGLDTLRLNAPQRTIVDDGHIDTGIHMLQREHSTWRSVDRPAQRGDRVTVNFDSFLEDGQAFAGGKADNVNIELGAGGMLPEFENALIGAKAGQSYDFPVNFPKDYGTPFLAGKTACFTVLVTSICEFDLVPLDDAFAAKCGSPGGMASLREAMRAHLQKQHDAQDQLDIASDLLRQLVLANSFVPLPLCLIAQRIHELQRELAEAHGAPPSLIQVDESLIAQAHSQVHMNVLVRRLAQQENIKIYKTKDLNEQIVTWLKDRAAKNAETPPS